MKKLTDTAENTVKRFFIDNPGDFGWGQSVVEAEEVCGETGNVRAGHGSSVNGVSLPARPGGSDVHAGGPDINDGSIIGEDSLRVIDIRCRDGDRLLNAGRRAVGRVLVFVSGGYDDGDTFIVKLKIESHVSGISAMFHPPSAYPFNGPVNNWSRFATYAYRSNRWIAGPYCLTSDPINASGTVVR